MAGQLLLIMVQRLWKIPHIVMCWLKYQIPWTKECQRAINSCKTNTSCVQHSSSSNSKRSSLRRGSISCCVLHKEIVINPLVPKVQHIATRGWYVYSYEYVHSPSLLLLSLSGSILHICRKFWTKLYGAWNALTTFSSAPDANLYRDKTVRQFIS